MVDMVEAQWLKLDQRNIVTQADRDIFDHAVRQGPFSNLSPVVLQIRIDSGEWQTVEVAP